MKQSFLKRVWVALLIVWLVVACNGPMVSDDFSASPAVTAVDFRGSASYLDWSPDDSQLLVVGGYRGKTRIVTLDLTTGAVHSIVATTGEQWFEHARWSPDGERVVFWKGGIPLDDDLAMGVWIAHLNSDEMMYLVNAGSPVWSSDGEYIYTEGGGISEGLPDIRQFNAATGEVESSYFIGCEEENLFLAATETMALSTNGQLVATCNEYEEPEELGSPFINRICILDLENGIARVIGEGITGSWSTWSPNGEMLAFVGRREGEESSDGLYLMNADGTCPTRMVDESVAFPVWSNDGTRIAFVYQDRIYMLNVEEMIGSDALNSRLSCP
jgi:Tol biopolymer transport system component